MPKRKQVALAALAAGGIAMALLASDGTERGAQAQSGVAQSGVAQSGANQAAVPPGAPMLALPIACKPGSSCFIQSHVDHDPGPGVRDYRCLGQTYNDHEGTDFRVPTLAAAADTPVLAAAPGTVRAVRNSVPDQRIGAIDLAGTNGIECGNGVVIDHGGGWETQYCHMRTRSVRVAAGDAVEAGQELGTIGLSGNTEFAHLHFSVRQDGRTIDPFSATGPGQSCDAAAQGLWSAPAAAQLAYARSVVLNTGFAAGPVTMDQIEDGAIPAPEADSGALVAYARAINLREGDVLALQLIGPGGRVLADTATDPLDRNKAQWMLFTGRRLRQDSWPQGRYTARLTIASDGETVHEEAFNLTL